MAKHQEIHTRVDEHISRVNIEYRERLESRRLRPLVVQAVPEGTWEVFRDRQLSRGGTLEQCKHPCLTNDLEFIERLGAMVREASAAAIARPRSRDAHSQLQTVP